MATARGCCSSTPALTFYSRLASRRFAAPSLAGRKCSNSWPLWSRASQPIRIPIVAEQAALFISRVSVHEQDESQRRRIRQEIQRVAGRVAGVEKDHPRQPAHRGSEVACALLRVAGKERGL